ncbi:hypothetical protein NEF87_004263 [Candidatus Lokiarchaeum ossiferum]|uniref:Glycosyltransferase 2-like domain-containing protein n=1 Tax=Candidatus Lokiarchaeum ossiferum TaxID=2951803 RepID=A0ABY6HWS8_9ARCH|nr:hypothetical protein NEF87_004263 [Candidatus Lokiarchaeum sp. B-35]
MEYPLISVIIPTHNRFKQLKRAIKSVIRQNYPSTEIIVIDDHSDYSVQEELGIFKEKNIIFQSLKGKHGAPAARNLGIKLAKGKYIAFLDDDDEFFPNKLMKQYQIFNMNSPEIGIVYCGFIKKLESNQIIYEKKLPAQIKNPKKKILETNFIGSCSYPLIRTKYIHEVNGFDDNLDSAQDWDLWIRLIQKYKIKFVNEHLVNYYIQNQSISSNYFKKVRGILKILIKNYIQYNKYPEILSYQLNNLAFRLLMNNSLKLANKFYFASIAIQSKRLESYIFIFINSFLLKPFFCLFKENLLLLAVKYLKKKKFQVGWLIPNIKYLNSIHITS